MSSFTACKMSCFTAFKMTLGIRQTGFGSHGEEWASRVLLVELVLTPAILFKALDVLPPQVSFTRRKCSSGNKASFLGGV